MTALHPSVTKCHLAGSADCRFEDAVKWVGWLAGALICAICERIGQHSSQIAGPVAPIA